MKRLFYFILLLVGISTVHSCKDLADEDGNPLLDINNNTGLIGARALYREITDADTLATYYYNGLQVSKVITRKASVTDVQYSGDKISRVTFKGFLDSDNNGTLDTDSTSYEQQFTYGNTGTLDIISETRSVYKRTPPVPPSTIPGPWVILRKSKTLYNLTYSSTTSKLAKIVMRTGDEAIGVPFAYTNYSETNYEYSGDNVTKVVRSYGPVAGGVFGAVTSKYGYEFSDYDAQINPFTLLPMAYKISRLLSTEKNDLDSWILSPNSPKRKSVADLTQPVPIPVVVSTNYNYDAQTYMRKGYGVNYIYKPL
ncbi:hypothetical protein [Chryseobacterium cheonjiense]|uniref:DUF4595 domain-containing protein n=1 Tax=Chryseobacterium cheonjiense TaxID=2728845 RepID=A0A7Y0A7C1_9FLAO|nr:hypothetical protein [Chryseobacterium cheonjiense]NML58050.1 hypothetical protein [Chryseobacterium cheonjiense]